MKLKKTLTYILCVLCLSLSFAAQAAAPTVTSSGVDGKLVSYSHKTTGSGSAHVIASTPGVGNYVLTQFCSYGDAFIYSSSLDFIGVIVGTTYGPDHCVTFSPGLVIPAGDDILASTAGVSYISMTGILVLP